MIKQIYWFRFFKYYTKFISFFTYTIFKYIIIRYDLSLSFDNISFSKLAIIFIIAGVVLVLAILGSSATSLFSESITEEAEVKMKQEGNCIVEAGDRIPRMISDCSYNVNDTVLITYKTKQPAIEKHQLK